MSLCRQFRIRTTHPVPWTEFRAATSRSVCTLRPSIRRKYYYFANRTRNDLFVDYSGAPPLGSSPLRSVRYVPCNTGLGRLTNMEKHAFRYFLRRHFFLSLILQTGECFNKTEINVRRTDNINRDFSFFL